MAMESMTQEFQDNKPSRRSSPRLDTVIRVDYRTANAFFTDFAENISEGGMFISTPNPLKPGTDIVIEFLLPELNRPLRVKGKVVWNREQPVGHNQRRGMGIKFEELTEEDKMLIAEVMRKLKGSPQ